MTSSFGVARKRDAMPAWLADTGDLMHRAFSYFSGRPRRAILVLIAILLCFLFSSHSPFRLYHRLRPVPICALPPSILESEESRIPKLLPFADATQLCKEHNLTVYPHRSSRRKVYDLILINTELDWLEIRLRELHSEVDYFVILESTETFTGHNKTLHFKENYHRFHNFSQKILYHALDLSNRNDGAWNREHYTRDAMFTAVLPHLLPPAAPQENDVILASDVDEIPRPSTIKVLRNCIFPQRTTLRSRFFYYSFQWQRVGEEWHHPQATYFTNFADTIRPEDLRMGGGWDFPNASWHCSSCFKTVAEMVNKIESFSHQEYNNERMKDPREIVRRVRDGVDLFERESEKYEKVEANDVPEFVDRNRDRFVWMVDRDPENANFADFQIEHGPNNDS
jgi:beta-1,4-mannosyl-glycoprotein beta-1,4-N-acetylglucosaminyltransferase